MTFWDAGEFIAAAHSLGIPHPPGTPLFVLALHVWAAALGRVMPYAEAANLFSAVCTALAAGVSGWLVGRGRREHVPAAVIAAALTAGAMSSIWLNASETEVYAAALLLVAATLYAADRAGREAGVRWVALTAYLIVLAVPVHLSALVAAPAAIVLAVQRAEGVDVDRGVLLGGATLIAVGFGRKSPAFVGIGVLAVVASVVAASPRWGNRRAVVAAAGVVGVAAVALSAVLFMLVRARLDPFLNQGNPSTWTALADAIARRQYDVAPLWPRQAPVWLQLANVGQYADWQVGLGLGASVLPSAGRTLATVLFLALGVYGGVAHRADDRRTWWGVLTLLICGSLGVAAYLNLKAGPSIGAGVLPASAPHEARERDYFFVLAFWAWGLWAGYGAVALVRRWRWHAGWGVALAALPIALNWHAVSRRQEPEASLAETWARAMLDAVPPRAVLFAAGDNDTYPLWYAQEVLGYRRDVRVVTLPLMPAEWYRAELHRRGDLLPDSAVTEWDDEDDAAAVLVARRAAAAGRPVAVSLYVDAADREALGARWRANGLTFVLDSAGKGTPGGRVVFDTVTASRLAAEVAAVRARPVGESTDVAPGYFQSLLECPAYVARRGVAGPAASLDSLCNFR